MNLKSSLLILLHLKIISSQLYQSDIDKELQNSRELLIYSENRIGFVYSTYTTQVDNCSKVLNSSSQLKEVSTALENFRDATFQISTIKNFEAYENLQTCGDINLKIILLDFERQKLTTIQGQINSFINLIYKQYVELMGAYQKNLNALGLLSTNERMVAKILVDFPVNLNVLSTYLPTLASEISKLIYYSSVLSALRKYYCPCLESIKFRGNLTLNTSVQTLESNLIRNEAEIQTLTSTALTRTNDAISGVVSTSLTHLKALQSSLKNVSTTSDFGNIISTTIQSCNDFNNRIKFLETRRLLYNQILSTAILNKFYLTSNRVGVASVSSVDGSLNADQKLRISAAVNATINVESSYSKFISNLQVSIVEISKMIASFYIYGDTFCSCNFVDSGTSSTEVSTSSIPLSTLKITTSSTLAPLTFKTLIVTSPTTIRTLILTTSTTSSTLEPSTTSTTILEPSTTTTTTLEPSTTTTTTLAPSTTTTTTLEPSTTSTTTLAPSTTTTTTLEPSTTTTTILEPSTTTTTLRPCGSLLDVATNDPAISGFLSGTYSDGSSLYPGVGNFTNCGSGGNRPARIKEIFPVAYGPCGSGEATTSEGVKFFEAHPNLKWIAVNWSTDQDVIGVGVADAVGSVHYVTRHNRTGYQQIGAYYAGNPQLFFWDGIQLNFWDTNWEVLACQ